MIKKIFALIGLLLAEVLVASPYLGLKVKIKNDDLATEQTFVTAYDKEAKIVEKTTPEKGIEITVTPTQSVKTSTPDAKNVDLKFTISEIKHGVRKLIATAEIISKLGQNASLTEMQKGKQSLSIEVRPYSVDETTKTTEDSTTSAQEK